MTEIHRATLANGLKVLVHPDRNTSMVVLDTLYNVGSRDESPIHTGMAHLFEHLMFGGSANVPDFDRAVEHAGGINNAWTSEDFTNFYTVMPAQNVETAFWVESDRMLAPNLDAHSLDIQRKVVIEEFKQTCLNTPYGDVRHHLLALAYRSHPYRWPTLGISPDHVAAATEEDVRAFFNSHYAPNNAILSISGNIEPSRAFDLAEKYYGDIQKRAIAPRTYLPEPPVTEPRRLTVHGDVPHTAIVIAFHMAPVTSPDYVVTDIISDILANGQSSRLITEVVIPDNVVSSAAASISGNQETGLLLVQAILKESTPQAVTQAEELIWQQLHRLAQEEPDPMELKRCTARYAANIAFDQMKYKSIAEEIAIAELNGIDIDSRIDRYRAVSPARIRQVASSILRPEKSITLIYAPNGSSL
ncbi:MAG: insulinase family protein [Alloprevotella sp.]|nr:insulinase family protein [Alloprevotella sp.]